MVFVPKLPEPRDYKDLPGWARYSDTTFVRLLNAAWNSLHERDAFEISLRQLAGEVGISAPAAHHYFPNKDALLGELSGLCLASLLAEIGQVATGILPWACDAWVGFAEARPRHYTHAFSAKFTSYTQVAQRRDRLWKYLVGLTAQELGFEPTTQAEVYALWAMLHGAASLVAAGEPRQPPEALLAAIAAHFEALRRAKRP